MQNYEGKAGTEEQVVASLGTIEERFLEAKEVGIQGFHRGIFWLAVDKELNDLTIEDVPRSMIESEILKRVPRPATDEWSLWAVTCVPRYDE